MDDVERFLRDVIADTDGHFDRVARINAPMVRARGEMLTMPDGYRNPSLLDGCNVVMAYLRDLAKDRGVILD